jgi:putative N6-adenine-specific DNA methylase
MKDEVTVGLDTSGESLHKRGYRKLSSKAPITETLAAALILLTPWREDRILVDPFCGSGTIPIEAAMIGANIAPGMNRSFRASDWKHLIPSKMWYDCLDEAREEIRTDIEPDIQGYDIDPEMIKIARANAKLAGVEHLIHFQTRPLDQLSHSKKYGFIITNPPYGERLDNIRAAHAVARQLGKLQERNPGWALCAFTADMGFEREYGYVANRRRRYYNGRIECEYHIFDANPKPVYIRPEWKNQRDARRTGGKGNAPAKKPFEKKSYDKKPFDKKQS